MTTTDIIAAAALVVSAFTLAVSMYLSGIKNAGRMARIELKVDTMWDFQMRRAGSEAVSRGIAIVNSPIEITDDAKKWMAPLIQPIRDFYRNMGRHMTDRELFIEIERRFGEQILTEICIPHGLSHGACLLIAMQAVKDPAVLL